MLIAFQAELLKFIQSFHTPVLDAFFIIITNLGSQAFYYIAIPFFYWGKNTKLGLKIACTLIISIYINIILKEITALPRPIDYPGIRSIFVYSAGGFSFPSGHAQGATTLWGMIMLHYDTCLVKIIGFIAIALVSISRLYLGVHWPLDVVAGIAIGLVAARFGFRFKMKISDYNLTLKLVLSIIAPLSLVLFCNHPDIYKYMSMLAGILFGSTIEIKYIGFDPKYSGMKEKVTKYGIGAVIFLLVYIGLKYLLAPGILSLVIIHFIVGLWLSLGAPILFEKLNL